MAKKRKKFNLSWVKALVEIIISTAAFLGMDSLVTKYEAYKADKNNITADAVINDVDKVLSVAQKKLSTYDDKYIEINNKLTSKLNAIPYTDKFSGRARDLVIKYRKGINKSLDQNNKNIEKVNNDVQNLSREVDAINNRAATLAAASDSYRSSNVGKTTYDNIIKDAQTLSKKIEQGVDKYV